MTITPTATPDRVRARDGWRRFVPWDGRPTAVDLALIATILAVVAFGFALRPLKPFLLASHPVVLELLTGDLTTIGAAAAFARVGDASLAPVIAAGAVGMVKLDWLTWWTGRRWGAGIVSMFTTSRRAQGLAARAADLNPWVLRAVVVLAVFPGVPSAVVYAMAGWAGMRVATFLVLDLAGALLMTGLVASLGYALGQNAVDAVLLVDRYASVVSIALLTVPVMVPLLRRLRRRSGVRGANQRCRPLPRRRPLLPRG